MIPRARQASPPLVREPTLLGPAHKGFVATAQEIDRWLDGARIGEVCVYARASVMPAAGGGGMRARGLDERGVVRLEARRRWVSNPDLFEFRMRRTDAGVVPEPVAPPVPLSPTAAALMDYIEHRADAGLPMEANPQVADRLGLRAGVLVHQHLEKLIKLGLVRRQPMLRKPFRIITIVATGARTAGDPA